MDAQFGFLIRRISCVSALAALLVGCGGAGGGGGGGSSASLTGADTTAVEPNRVVLGPLSGATVRAYHLEQPETVIEGPLLTSQSLTSLTRAGSFHLALDGVPDDAWILVKATGGQDIDANDDGVLDAAPTANTGTIHALAKAADWRKGGTNVTLLSDIAWLYAQDVAEDSQALEQRMNSVAANLLREDLNNDGVINRRDIDAFAPVQHKHSTQQNYAEMLPDDDPETSTLVELIHGNAPDHAKNQKFREQVDETSWQNIEPTALAEADQAVEEQTLVTLAGKVGDSDGEVAVIAWSQTSGPAVSLAAANSATASFIAPVVTETQILRFTLTVTDDGGAVASDEAQVTVHPVNSLPTVNAGGDLSVNEYAAVTLTGEASDPDGTIVDYAWSQTGGEPVQMNGADSASLSFRAPMVGQSQLLSFELTVTDNEGASARDSVAVVVNPFNAPPTANAGADQAVDEQTPVTLSGAGADSDGSVFGYGWRQLSGPQVALSGTDQAQASFVAPVLTSSASLVFELQVTDNEGAVASDSVLVTVNPVNAAPTADAGADQAVDEQTSVILSGAGSDSDGSVVAYAWRQLSGPAVTLEGVDQAQASFVAPVLTSSESLVFELQVIDNEGAVASDSVLVTVNPVNAAPTADAGADQAVDEQTPVTLSGAGSDSDGTVAAYAWRQLSGPAVTLEGVDQAQASFVAPVLTSSASLVFELQVTDNEGAVASDSVLVTVNPVNAAPTADAGADLAVEEQTTVALNGAGGDSDGSVIAYAWRQLSGPAVTLEGADQAQATFAAPAVSVREVFSFELEVTDNEGASATDGVVVTVNPQVRVTVSGTVTAGPGQFVDSDVNDPVAPYQPNDVPAEAQPVSNPATVGGFASAFGTGWADDRFGAVGDVYDAYEVSLSAGDNVVLSVADFDPLAPGLNDLDLYLYDASNPTSPLAWSASAVAVESLQAPYTGNFHVLVHGYYGFSNYTLTLGQGAPAASAKVNSFSASEESFLPSELIVEMEEAVASDPRLTGQQKMQAVQQRLSDLGVSAKAGGPGRPLLVDLGDAQKRQQTLATLKPRRQVSKQPAWSYGDQQEKVETLQILKSLQMQPDVKSASLNYLRRSQAVPNDSLYGYQWHYPLINLPQAWELSTGSNVVVAVVDTGVFMAHPDLAANLTNSGYDFISQTSISVDGDGIDSNPDDPGDNSNSFHGTHVAGTVAAVSNNGVDVAGVAWNAKVMPVRVLGWGGGTDYDVLQGVRYAAGLSNDSGTVPAAPAQVINLSLGGPGYSEAFQNSIYEVRSAGSIVIAAAGNNATSAPSYPAAYDGVVSVSSVRYDKALAYYSNFGSTIDIAAPGGDMSVDQNGDYNGDGVLSTLVDKSSGTRQPVAAFYQGTSMAAPHVAGVAALMKSVYPGMTPAEFDSAISSGAITEDLGYDGAAVRNDSYGYGLIDGLKAVQYASELATGEPMPPQLAVDRSSLDFGATATSQVLTVSNAGGGDLYITDVRGDASWLSVSAGSVDANNLGTYSLSVDRTGLSDGDYSATLTISSDTAGSLDVTVSMRVTTVAAPTPDVGYQWVLLIDADTQATIKEVGVAVSGGQYSYSFSDVVPGTYYVAAGSDSDNDYRICDPGESCGSYPEAASPEPLSITSDTSGLDFTSRYGAELGPMAVEEGVDEGFQRRGGGR
ncbi:S8 family serine peptidase [Motiliproteus sp. SC1-56]|uniref:PKD domain-containing protein n=1 Tax=Motiliproteus sp. SC1-56 TaxID=2799565 RepID=UPI001A8E653A|nr:S8 family serine peptidase [Motiliproteus sp. SC1-56]